MDVKKYIGSKTDDVGQIVLKKAKIKTKEKANSNENVNPKANSKSKAETETKMKGEVNVTKKALCPM